ncbi:MAG: enoyl-CoA hydratase/isomerase family protein [Armatimonadetes bacterium]|nr:enoyl-CoA hydratase/isomerase family protein [Armatimonadota bacterium]
MGIMLSLDQRGSALHITLDRPDVRNAINDELIQKLDEAFSTIADDIRIVFLRGNGKVFCAGGDLEWMRRAGTYTEEQNYQDALKLATLFDRIAFSKALVVAVVQGAAFGGGAGLVAAADMAIVTQSAKFSFSEVRLGLIPATISTLVVPKIGYGHARHLFATGEIFDGNHAKMIGLAHSVVDDESGLEAEMNRVAKLVLQAGPAAVAAAKLLVHESPYSKEEAARKLAAIRSTPEAREGLTAFLEKRPAAYVEELP